MEIVCYPPQVIACAALYLAARKQNVALPAPWWQIFDADLECMPALVCCVAHRERERDNEMALVGERGSFSASQHWSMTFALFFFCGVCSDYQCGHIDSVAVRAAQGTVPRGGRRGSQGTGPAIRRCARTAGPRGRPAVRALAPAAAAAGTRTRAARALCLSAAARRRRVPRPSFHGCPVSCCCRYRHRPGIQCPACAVAASVQQP